jgi:hemerythrin-like domain-containing protein
MRDTLFLLRLEHGNLSKLLGLIEDQVALAAAGQRMDEELLRLASEYFADYPDRCHHPKEDLVYELLGLRAPDACAGLRDVIADHRKLHELARAFAAAVQRPPGEPDGAESRAREVMLEFTGHYRRHIRLEEEQFFRLAEQRLSTDDWDSLDFTMFEQDDPLFDHAAERRFADLRDRIEALAEQGRTRRSVMEAAAGLSGLTGVESFNEAMRSTGQRFRLVRFAVAGYGLEGDRKLLLHIPECSAERAAWCAYCYLQGSGWPWAPAAVSADPRLSGTLAALLEEATH